MTPHNKIPELMRREIVRRVWAGDSLKTIAADLDVTDRVVRKYRKQEFDKARAEGKPLPLCRCGQTAGHRGGCGGKGRERDKPKAQRVEEASGETLPPPFSTYPPGHIFSLFYTPGAEDSAQANTRDLTENTDV